MSWHLFWILPVSIAIITAIFHFGWKKVLYVLGPIVGIVLLFWGVPRLTAWWKSNKETKEPKAEATAKIKTKILIPRFDSFTPCETAMDFPFELDTQGDPVYIKFPGVPEPVYYSGKGTLNIKERGRSGVVKFWSARKEAQARVRISEVAYIFN